MKAKPPSLARKLLRWFCREDYFEELEGDLIEVFEKRFEDSPFRARWHFWWAVIRYFRPGFVRSFFHVNNSTTAMFQNNLKVSWRNLKRQPFFTFLNTFGLAIGMAGGLLITLFIIDELNFDRMFPDANRIYRVNIENRIGGETNKYAAVSGPLAEVMRRDYPQVELVTRFRHTGSKLVREAGTNRNVREEHVAGVDSTFFEMFGLGLIYGNEATAFSQPNSVVLTKTAAEKYFPADEALGKSLLLDNEVLYNVTGVMDDLPKNSFLRDHGMFLSISSFKDATSIAWNNWNFPTFAKLRSDADVIHFQAYLADVKERYLIPWAMTFVPGLTLEKSRAQERETGDYMRFDATALTDIHLYSPNLSGEFSLNGDVQDVYILAFIGIFLVALASVNFMNLSTARSLKRAKEVGIRKTLGSTRKGLTRQFLLESTMVSVISMVIALFIGFLTLPAFNALAGKSISIPANTVEFWLIIGACTLLMGLLSGSYPALVLSGFKTTLVLKGKGESQMGGSRVRNSLVIVQFAISVFLIASTLVVYQQLKFIQTKDLGYSKEQVLVIEDVDGAGDQLAVFKEEVERMAQVKQVSLSSYLPTPSERTGTTFFPEGHVLEGSKAIIIGKWIVDFDYVSTLGLDLIAGRDFDSQFATDSTGILLNEAAVAMLGVSPEEALGMRITDDFRNEQPGQMLFYTVIGVIKDFHFETLRNPIDAMSLVFGANADKMMVKLETENLSEHIDTIESIWNNLAPGQPLNFYFMDDSFNSTYEAEQRLGKIFMTFTSLSIFIACLGLFGLAAFNAEKRGKEIGIRKVLGASIGRLSFKLTLDFLKLVVFAVVVALPIAWYSMKQWLQDFSYRIDIPWWVFPLAAILAILISVLTVSYQSIRAASRNPVKWLRSE